MESLDDICAGICAEKEQRIKENIVNEIVEIISNKYDILFHRNMIDYWFSMDAPWDFASIYKSSYKNEGYSVVLTQNDSNNFFMMGKNIVFYLKTLQLNNKAKLLTQVKKFVEIQVNDSDNWCEAEYEMYSYLMEHNGEIVEENPI